MTDQLIKPTLINMDGKSRADVLFFGESPGKTEMEKGQAFIGPAGKILQDVIQIEIPKLRVVLDNVVPRWLAYEKPHKKEYDEFSEYRTDSIRRWKPKVIVLLGEHAQKAFGLMKDGPVASNGVVLDLEGRKIVRSIHPAYALRDITKLPMFKPVFQAIRMCLKKSDTSFMIATDTISAGAMLLRTAKMSCGFDLETTSLDPKEGNILTAAISTEDEDWVIPVHHFEGFHAEATEKLLRWWWPLGPRIVHNGFFELAWMRSIRADDPKVVHDTMIQAFLVNENEPRNLDWQVINHLKRPPYWTDVKDQDFSRLPLETLGYYNANDALCTRLLDGVQRKILTKDQIHLADEMLTPLMKVLLTMQKNGIRIDRKKLASITRSQRTKRNRLFKANEREFPGVDVASPKQMRALLFDDKGEGGLGLEPVEKTRTGLAGTDALSLSILAKEEPRLKALSDARSVDSLLNRVLDPWKEFSTDGYIRTTFNLVSTGRLSSSNPNLQNTDRDGPQKKCMVSRFKGGKIVQLDYSQHELRTYAAGAGDAAFLTEFTSKGGGDPHERTAATIRDQGVECSRSTGKNVNFATIYDVSPYGLQRKYQIPIKVGGDLIRAWFKAHPEAKVMHRMVDEQIETQGYVESMFSSRRHLNDISDRHQRRAGYNFVVQCPAVYICFLAMIEVEKYLRKNKLRSLMILQIHDSIVLDCPESEVIRVSRKAKQIMLGVDYWPFCQGRLIHDVPLAVDVKVGDHF